MPEILFNRPHRQNLFPKGFPSNLFRSPGYVLAEAFFSIDLSNPACIPVACRPHKQVRVEIPELKRCNILYFFIAHLYITDLVKSPGYQLKWRDPGALGHLACQKTTNMIQFRLCEP